MCSKWLQSAHFGDHEDKLSDITKNVFWSFLFLPPKTLVFEGAMDWRIAAECHHEHTNTLLEALKLHIQFENHNMSVH